MDYYRDIQPIHELPSDELEDLLSHALEHLEFLWTTKPEPGESFNGICREVDFDLLTIVLSIKKSLGYFHPDYNEDLAEIADASDAELFLAKLNLGNHSFLIKEGVKAMLKALLQGGPYFYCEPEGRDAALENFRDMERAVFKYAESARHYYHDAVMKEVTPLVIEGKKRRRQLNAPRQKKNRYVLKLCRDLMERKPSTAAAHLFSRFPYGEDKAVMVDGIKIYRGEDIETEEEKIFCVRPDGTRMQPIGMRAFQKYFTATEKSWNDNS